MVRSPSLTDKRARYEASPPRHDNCAACRRHRHFAEPLGASVGKAFGAHQRGSVARRTAAGSFGATLRRPGSKVIWVTVDLNKFLFPIVRVDPDGNATTLAGTAFAITPGGGLMTCRHVVDVADDDGRPIPTAIVDGDRLVPIGNPVYLEAPEWDMAFLPAGLGREHPHYLPLLDEERAVMGFDVYSIGYYSTAGQIQRGLLRAEL